MIVDTSALIASLYQEEGHEPIFRALVVEDGCLPAPALVEYRRVASRKPDLSDEVAEKFIAGLLNGRLRVLEFTSEHARVASAANRLYGTGLGTGGTLNLLDLMVYGCARVERPPILCTGRDFAATDAAIHPASRTSA